MEKSIPLCRTGTCCPSFSTVSVDGETHFVISEGQFKLTLSSAQVEYLIDVFLHWNSNDSQDKDRAVD